MWQRLAGKAGIGVLALCTSACMYGRQNGTQVPVDYSDYAHYNRPFASSPTVTVQALDNTPYKVPAVAPTIPVTYPDPQARSADASAAGAGGVATMAPSATPTTPPPAGTVEYQDVEATPGTACYDAAVKAGIVKGTCTMISDHKYVLVGQKAH